MKKLLVMILLFNVGCKKEVEEKRVEHEGHAAHAGHEHNAAAKKHVDPGPRLVSLAERLAEEAAAARDIGPARPAEFWGRVIASPTDPDAEAIVLSANVPEPYRGSVLDLCGKADVQITRARPHALSAIEMNLERPQDSTAMHAQMDHAEHQHCMQQVADDLYAQKGISLDHDLAFQMVLHATVANGNAVIDDVAAEWPEEVVADAQDCFVGAFRGVAYKTTATRSYSFTWPVCITVGGKTAANDNTFGGGTAANDNQETGS